MPLSGNGNKLVYTLMGFLFVALMTVVGWAKSDIDAKVTKLEDTRDLVIALTAKMDIMQRQMTRLERKMDDQRDALDRAGYRIHKAGPEDWP